MAIKDTPLQWCVLKKEGNVGPDSAPASNSTVQSGQTFVTFHTDKFYYYYFEKIQFVLIWDKNIR